MPAPSMITRRHLPGALLGLSLILGLPAAAHADPAVAEALFQQGRDLLERGEIEAACAKFESSQASEPSAGTLLNLGDCRARQGKTATAWAHFVAAERLSELQSRPEHAAEAKRRRTELETTLSTLTVQAAEPPPELEVRVNGRKLDLPSLRSRLPMDPGKLSLEFSAPGYEPARLDVELRTPSHHLVLQVPSLEPKGTAPASPGRAPASSGSAELDTAALPSSNTLAWVVGGAGVAALAVGGTFGVMALGSNADAKSACDDRTSQCPDAALQAERDRDREALISTVGVATGLVGIGLSAVMLLTSRSPAPREQSQGRFRFEFSPGKAQVFGSARF